MDEVHLDLDVLSGADARGSSRASLRFLGCAALATSVDFWAKLVCGDVIADATCEPLSAETAAALEQNPRRELDQPLGSLLTFTIGLCPPSGELRIVARDFAFAEEGQPAAV